MDANRETLEAQLIQYESQLKGLKSFVKELKARTAEYGTDKEHFETDLLEAEHNIKYYEEAIGHLKNEIGGSAKGGRAQSGTDTILPRTAKQCIGSFVFSSVSFIAGAILGSKLKSRGEGQGKEQKKGEQDVS
jgi:hypothetical protein